MKKLLIAIAICVISSMGYAMESKVQLGLTTTAEKYNNHQGGDRFSPNISLEVEQWLLLGKVGGGIGYHHNVGGSHISTIPVYAMGKIDILPIIPYSPYFVGRAGMILKTHNDVNGSAPKGREYYSLGLGMELPIVDVEAAYHMTRIEGDHRGNDWLKQVSLSASVPLF